MSTSSISITDLNAKLVTFNTPLSFTQVISRLDEAVNKQGSANILAEMRNAKTRAEIDQVVESITGLTNDFLYFVDMRHNRWLDIYHATTTPQVSIYTIGNPLFAQAILKHDLRAALHIPPRLLVLEKSEGQGTQVMYQLPSSVMVLPGNDDAELKEKVEVLDRKLEALVARITEIIN
ncbi:hypothetical protein AGABI2DRAFT_68010 [Agaricus bisporus var. bisporus H97]|uniref:hypothetical protein n=1 Tax=Agaricus bisporus var. bisporus (strain H97 / ATCC MYA-4626 / FGSC 10389) TaxID=936046 RepID=UPI00029F7166|nr:hypothetical protein AGABI2DRAFT_68010 [Agaricus bisporus var. bisporus H97]EKV48188.1 hypothetical protein AGABI2DRAFT_68010 [Agaricus bisporus var. bisporus H97]